MQVILEKRPLNGCLSVLSFINTTVHTTGTGEHYSYNFINTQYTAIYLHNAKVGFILPAIDNGLFQQFQDVNIGV